MKRRSPIPVFMVLAVLAAALLFQGCANSPPPIAPALLAPTSGTRPVHIISFNALSNYGKSGFKDTAKVERGDGRMVSPTYENSELGSAGTLWPGRYGFQLDLNGFDKVFLAASLYEENFPSILANPAIGEAGPVKTYAVGSLVLNIPWRVEPGVVWVIPNWRTALARPSLTRFGVNFAYSLALGKAL